MLIVFYAYILFTLVPTIIKVNGSSVCVSCEYLCYIAHNYEANDRYLCKWEVKDAGRDTKSHGCKNIGLRVWLQAFWVGIPCVACALHKHSYLGLHYGGDNTQSPFLPTFVLLLMKEINPAIMPSTCQRSR